MSYLLDKKAKQRKFFSLLLLVVVCLVLFYFRTGIFGGLSRVSHTIFRPVLILGGKFGRTFGSLKLAFVSKNSLSEENMNLKLKLAEDRALISNYNSLLADNESMQEILGRKGDKVEMTLSAILSKPNQSPYDTLIIDAGVEEGIEKGDMVFALGNIPVGRVAEVHLDSSKVILFSTSGEKTRVAVTGKNIFVEIIGRGGGNFEIIMPSDLALVEGDQVVYPGTSSYLVATVKTTISDPRDSLDKALLVSPVNVQELKFVQVAK